MVAIELWIRRTRILLVCSFMSSEVRVGRCLHSIMILVSVGLLDSLLECWAFSLNVGPGASVLFLYYIVTIYSISAEDVIIE